MCAIILKSEQEISEILASWKTGIDISCTDVEDKMKIMKVDLPVFFLLLWSFSKSQYRNYSSHQNAIIP
jgi:hypothetical protein